MFCSFVVLAIGFWLYFRSVRLQTLGLMAIPFGIGAGILAVVWPGILTTVAYGCEPGLAVLFVILGMQWFAVHRYRRHLQFMPGFSHPKNGSSSHRQNMTRSARLASEPSTVDAPRLLAGSNQKNLATQQATQSVKT
jgi:Cu/Ag efflux pump CusA